MVLLPFALKMALYIALKQRTLSLPLGNVLFMRKDRNLRVLLVESHMCLYIFLKP